MITLYHYTDESNLKSILEKGLKATSKYEEFTDVRKNVVYCWLSSKDNKLKCSNPICLKVMVDEHRCLIADMEWISFAMMRKYGGKKYGGMNISINLEAADYFALIYKATAKRLAEYETGNFFSPEVSVKDDVDPHFIEICKAEG